MNNLSFTAIDFETSNNARNSICQIGICKVEKGKAVFADQFLVQPPGNEYSHWNVAIHGISADATEDKPLFPELWNDVKQYFENQLIVAHNSDFDIDCLIQTLEFYDLQLPRFKVECTYKISGLNLIDLAESLDIEIMPHHNALYDAIMCAESYVKLISGQHPDLNKITKKEPKPLFEGHEQLHGSVLKPDLEHADPDSPFFNKKVVFTGVLDSMKREEAAEIVKKMGADIDTSVTKRTDFVIVGTGAGPAKLKKIRDYNNSGSKIKMIHEKEFLELIK